LLLGLIFGDAEGISGAGVAIGAVLGIAIGAIVGAIVERRHKGEARPLTKYEKWARGWMIGVGVVALVPLVAVAAVDVAAVLLLR
jgi:Na+-driven multidrug efflux pump